MSQIREQNRETNELPRLATLNAMSLAGVLALALAIGPVALGAPTSPNPLVRGADATLGAEDTTLATSGGVHSTSAGKHRTFGIYGKPIPVPKPKPITDPAAKPTTGKVDEKKPSERYSRSGPKEAVYTGTQLPDGGVAQAEALVPVDPCIQTLIFDDCNGNGISDGCDLMVGHEDADANGVIDTCQFALGDLDLDHMVGPRDLAMVLVRWDSLDSDRDPNGDGVINGADIAIILSNWTLDS